MPGFHEETNRVIRHLQRTLVALVDAAHTPELLKQAIVDHLERLLHVGPTLVDTEETLGPRVERPEPPPRLPDPGDIVYPFCGRDPRSEHIRGADDDLRRYTTPSDAETLLHGIRIPPGCDVVELPSIKPHVRDFFFVDGNVRHFVSIDDRPVDDRGPVTRVSFHSTCPRTRTATALAPQDAATCEQPQHSTDQPRPQSGRPEQSDSREDPRCDDPAARPDQPTDGGPEPLQSDDRLQRTYVQPERLCRNPSVRRKVAFHETHSHREEPPRARRRLRLSGIKLPMKEDSFESSDEQHEPLVDTDDVLAEYERYLRRKYLNDESSDSSDSLTEFEKQFRRKYLSAAARPQEPPPQPTTTAAATDDHEHSLAEFERQFRRKHGLPGAEPPRPMYPSCGPWSCGRRDSCADPFDCRGPANGRNVDLQLPEQRPRADDNAAALEQRLREKYATGRPERERDCSSEFEERLRRKYGQNGSVAEGERQECVEGASTGEDGEDCDPVSVSELERRVKRVLGTTSVPQGTCTSDGEQRSISEESLTREMLKVKWSTSQQSSATEEKPQ